MTKPNYPLDEYAQQLNQFYRLVSPEIRVNWRNFNNFYSKRHRALYIAGNYTYTSSDGRVSYSGYSPDLQPAIHELAHLIEIEDHRLFSKNWGMRNTHPRHFSSHIKREIRVWSIQYHICNYLSLPSELDGVYEIARHMSDFNKFYTQDVFLTELHTAVELKSIDSILNELKRKKELIACRVI